MLVVVLQNRMGLNKKEMTTDYVKQRTVTLEGGYQQNFSRISLEDLTYLTF